MTPCAISQFECETLGCDRESLRRSLSTHLVYALGKDPITATTRDWFNTTAYAVRERLIERWMETMRSYYRSDAKRVYYLSLEFLTGRLLSNSLLNMGFYEECREALSDLELRLDDLREIEADAALGNGGLGRLAACFLDSMATLSLPGYGYGIRYEYGMFHQQIEHGWQVEHPDNWLRYGNPWEFPRPEVLFPVKFGGRVVAVHRRARRTCASTGSTPTTSWRWRSTRRCRATTRAPSTTCACGRRRPRATSTWSYFNEGNYIKAVEEKDASENLSKVLYPDDTTPERARAAAEAAVLLRLRVAAGHPAALLSVPHQPRRSAGQGRDPAERHASVDRDSRADARAGRRVTASTGIARGTSRGDTFSYTNHTLMPEALETWPVSLFERVLPRHLQIIYEINHRFLERRAPPLSGRRRPAPAHVDRRRGRRAAGCAWRTWPIVGSHRVNGVSADSHATDEADDLRGLRSRCPRTRSSTSPTASRRAAG